MQTSIFDSIVLFPQTHEDIMHIFDLYIFEGEKDDDVFSFNKTMAGITYSFYGVKAFELILEQDKQAKLKLPDDIMQQLFPKKGGYKEGQFYTVSSLPQSELSLLFSLLREKKKVIFRNTITYSFACCNSYLQCSDAKQCLHPDNRFYNGCYYRKNLEAGRIFYGKNRNID